MIKLLVVFFGIILLSHSFTISFGQWTDHNETNPGVNQEIPDWIRNNAAWWANGSIDDQTFVSGIEYLIKEGIISISTTQSSEKTTDEIPSWIRTNVNWWADGMISDFDFVKGIEFLINSGIIQVKQTTQTQPDPPYLDIDVGPNNDTINIQYDLCSGNARCISGTIVKVVDGDTIQVDDEIVRFALSSAPELRGYGGVESRDFIQTLCPVGSNVIVDEDDSQTKGSHGRMVGVVYCNEINLNKELLDIGLGYLSVQFCDSSEFRYSDWAQKHGCES
ncbi:thermonuclease family protein [Nitrosopumilus sp.]|uniref:thermonuclease family protein n=1 Tax=Nitrosopumilus sp. TaxID=2024843 RepID=UPI00349FEFBF